MTTTYHFFDRDCCDGHHEQCTRQVRMERIAVDLAHDLRRIMGMFDIKARPFSLIAFDEFWAEVG